MSKLLAPKTLPGGMAFSLLILRVLTGVAFVFHAYGKVFGEAGPTGWMGPNAPYPGYALAAAAFSELVGGAFLALGLLTPIASLALLGTMGVAVYHHVNKGDTFVGGWELAAVYLAITLVFLTTGPGQISADSKVFGKHKS